MIGQKTVAGQPFSEITCEWLVERQEGWIGAQIDGGRVSGPSGVAGGMRPLSIWQQGLLSFWGAALAFFDNLVVVQVASELVDRSGAPRGVLDCSREPLAG